MEKTRQLCDGCHDDFYNSKNPYGVKECWHFKGAKVVKRIRIGTWQKPPYAWRPREVLSCYRPEGGVMLDRDDPRVVPAA